ncbi:hypothetical protein G7Y89_g11202 [Cudoniella acicularis]|uniref:DNA polymerase delta subunit 4 n=1 Tax=Cudoniella acicularis TaxID=354080 RepID=A0A8H4W0B8_9HELO|nr:hypothetical protein G7Y89_g11202 [Cudoniella acicularis]
MMKVKERSTLKPVSLVMVALPTTIFPSAPRHRQPPDSRPPKKTPRNPQSNHIKHTAKMPPTRRSRNSSGPAAKGSQKTLTFGQSKVTKSTPSTKDKSSLKSPKLPATDDIDVGHVSSEAAVQQQAQTEIERVKEKEYRSPEEEKAAKVTDTQIRRYWKEREAERRAPRVHQKELTLEEKILRLFDMSSQYGPCIGIARMKRWFRANKLGLNPPIEVLAVLLKEEEKGNAIIERAHVDELMSSKFIVDDS